MVKEKKLLVVILIFLLTFSYFAEVTQAIAAGNFVSLFAGTNGDVKNIEFDAQIKNGEENQKTIISDVNNGNLLMKFNLEVKDDGYLKNAKIQLSSSDKLNFVIKDDEIVETAETKVETEDVEEVVEEEKVINEIEDNNVVTTETTKTVETSGVESLMGFDENNLGQINVNAQENSSGVYKVQVKNDSEEETTTNEIDTNQNSVETKIETENEITSNVEADDEAENEGESKLTNKFIQKVENYEIDLNKIECDNGKLDLSIPIEYENEEFISASKLDCKFKAILTGVYVDGKGNENNVSKEVELELIWKDERTISIENAVSKYIQFGSNGLILQQIVDVKSSNENQKSLPIKETELNIIVPTIANANIKNISVLANTTKGTNGKGYGETTFSDANCKYNADEGLLNVKIENPVQVTNVVNEDYSTVEENRYYSLAGTDEYVITYIYELNEGASIEENLNVAMNVAAKVTLLNGDANSENINIANYEQNFEETLNPKGSIVSTSNVNETTNVSKVYGYLNNEEMKYYSKDIINISYTESLSEILVEDLENYYTNKNGNKVSTNDLYYKSLAISKQNFQEILGSEGKIEILNEENNVLCTIDSETANNSDENIIINFNDKLAKIKIKVINPQNTGNLVITNTKCVSNVSLSKADYANVKSISSKKVTKVKFDFLDDSIELDPIVITTELEDTFTDATLTIDKTNFSTVTDSEVEMIVALNNATEKSDIYGNSFIEIEMPEYVTDVKITDYNLARGEGLSIADIKNEYKSNGRIAIKIELQGKQTNINSGSLTNGTNIVLKSEIKISRYAPSVNDYINLYTYNSEATNYKDQVSHDFGTVKECGFEQTKITYNAPSGVVSINSIKNYNKNSDEMYSINEGKRIATTDVYSDAKRAQMGIAVLNNTENDISDVTILGRFPFNGVTDIETDELYCANIDCKPLSKISGAEGFKVYYSTNGKATRDLTNPENEWVENIDNISLAKSYLIVPTDETYTLKAKKSIVFTYDFDIPAQLEYNKSSYNTYITYYKDLLTGTEEYSRPNNILLTTGNGPEMEMNMTSNLTDKSVYNSEEFEVVINAKNAGTEIAENVVLNVEIVKNAEYISATADRENVNIAYENGILTATVDQMAVNSSFEIALKLKASADAEQGSKVEIKANATADKLGETLKAEINDISIIAAELQMTNTFDLDEYTEDLCFDIGYETNFNVKIKNKSSDTLENVIAISKFPKEINITDVKMITADEIISKNDLKNVEIDTNNNTVTLKINKMEANQEALLAFEITIGEIEKGILVKDTYVTGSVSADKTKTYNANTVKVKIGRPSIKVTRTSDKDVNEYLKIGDKITYIYTLKNEGIVEAKHVILKDKFSDGLVANEIYVDDGVLKTGISSTTSKEISLTFNIQPESEVKVYVKTVVVDVENLKEKTIENYAIINGENLDEIITDPIVYFIKNDEEESEEEKEEESTDTEDEQETDESKETENKGQTEEDESEDIAEESNEQTEESTQKVDINVNTYNSISGIVWLDSNKDGIYSNDEEKMSNITVSLLKGNAIIKTTTTDGNGKYTFSGLVKGEYVIIFKYDTEKYATTTFHKTNVDSTVNSDAYSTEIERNGKKEVCGVTDTITVNGADVENIDMGLIESAKFSLKLDNTITKVTVENKKGTTSTQYDNQKLAKCEIHSKYLSGSNVYIEYTLTVTNNGELTGFATELVDYLPSGTSFNSSLNPNWYTDSNGNIRTKALADKEIAPGESVSTTVILVKKMTNENTGLLSNTAEISQTYNIYGAADSNSTPDNKAQNEDDISTADIIITVGTGKIFIYTTASIIFLMIGITGGMIYIKGKKEQGGEL